MADLANRDDWERKLGRALGRLNRAHMGRLLEYMGDPPDINKVPESFWDECGEDLRQAIRPLLEELFQQTAETLMLDVGIGVDWALINIRAHEWARTYTYDLVKGINDTTRRALQNKVSAFFAEQMTLGELRASIQPLYGPVRAALIARTEITRAAVQGEIGLVKELTQQGVNMVAVWQTSNDDLVCPICGPRHGKKQGDGWTLPPPAHPNCRCWLSHEFVEG